MKIDPSKLVAEDERRGRGARSNRAGRFEPHTHDTFDDGWESLTELAPLKTHVRDEAAKTIISRNDSPDISFEQSINPYRGCEHGCIYCYARPGHAYLGHSPGLDFETQLYAKVNAAEILERELSNRNYEPKTIALGAVTDPYQPIERRYQITRSILEVLERTRHPVGIVTKSAGILRDIDILQRMAEQGLVKVALSITTLDRTLARVMEPRAATPTKRLEAVRKLSAVGVPVTVMVAPIIPAINDTEIEAILEAAQAAGATEAGYVLLRLPLELKVLFREWLVTEFPDRADKVIHLLQSMHGGKDYVAAFGQRQRGTGPYADLIARRFRVAAQRWGLERRAMHRLRTDLFQRPIRKGGQMMLI
jgi:DNA repair photolyase